MLRRALLLPEPRDGRFGQLNGSAQSLCEDNVVSYKRGRLSMALEKSEWITHGWKRSTDFEEAPAPTACIVGIWKMASNPL